MGCRSAAAQHDITLSANQAILWRWRFFGISVCFPAFLGALRPEKCPGSGIRVGTAQVGLQGRGHRRGGLCVEAAESHRKPGDAGQFEELASAYVLDVLVHMSSDTSGIHRR